jgi:uncharacterized membrane protein
MTSLYLLLKFLHVASVIVWVGGLVALGIMTARLARSGDSAGVVALRQQSLFFRQHVVAVAGIVTLLAGGAMVAIGGLGEGVPLALRGCRLRLRG